MKTTVSFKRISLRAIIFILIVAYLPALLAQSTLSISGFANELVFKDPSIKSGMDLKNSAACLFKTATTGADAIVSAGDFVNGVSVKKIADKDELTTTELDQDFM